MWLSCSPKYESCGRYYISHSTFCSFCLVGSLIVLSDITWYIFPREFCLKSDKEVIDIYSWQIQMDIRLFKWLQNNCRSQTFQEDKQSELLYSALEHQYTISGQKTAPDIQVTKFNYLKKGQEMKKLCSPSGPLPSVFSIALFKVNFAHCCLLLEKIKRKLHLALILIVSN